MVVVECCGELLKWNGEEKQVISGTVDGDGIARSLAVVSGSAHGFPQASQCHSIRSVVGAALIWVLPSKPAADLTEVMPGRKDGMVECCVVVTSGGTMKCGKMGSR